MKILGIGNAIVDVLCRVPENFLTKHSLSKGTMKLINENEFQSLLSTLTIENTISGGSVANTIVGISQLGNDVGFLGKVNDDNFGKQYEKGLISENVKFLYNKKKEMTPTGTCLILITPDSERTMCAYLGIAGKIDENDVDENIIRKSEIIFLEGYLWDEGGPKRAFEKAINCSKISAMSLSDQFCVERHKKNFLNLVKNKLDIVFANEHEISSLISTKSFSEVINFSKELKKDIIITRGDKGSVSVDSKGNLYECEPNKNLKIVDLTGAGDLFAAGFMHGKINKFSTDKCLEIGTELSSKIIQKIGARI